MFCCNPEAFSYKLVVLLVNFSFSVSLRIFLTIFFCFSVNRENYEPNNSRYCDEVRLMLKVLDRAQPEDCLRTLHLTKGNMHHAIKLVKLKKLVKAHGVTDHDLLSTLQIEDWDVAKAASYIMKRLQ